MDELLELFAILFEPFLLLFLSFSYEVTLTLRI